VAFGIAMMQCAGTLDAAQDSAGLAKSAYARAVDLEAEGNDPAALSLLWQAAGLAPRDADVQNRLGEALQRLGALDAAVDAFQRALAARPDSQKAANNLILTLVQAGRGPEALKQARAFIAASPGDPDRYFTLGLAQSEQDLIVATNVLPYLDDTLVSMALANISAMLAPGGAFLHNESRSLLTEVTRGVDLPLRQARTGVIATVRGAAPLSDAVLIHEKTGRSGR